MLHGRMMDVPLTLTHFLDRARTFHASSEIVSRRADRSLHRETFAAFHRRACQLANALSKLGVREGTRVGTLCWNHNQHLEAYFTLPAMGAVVHTLNIRLHPDELGYIANHAEDEVIVVDHCLLPLFAKFRDRITSLRHVIVVADNGVAPEGTHDYETLIADEATEHAFPKLDENAAAMLCYTSGTTGNPKGVLYSHRSIVLHTLVACTPDALGVANADAVLPVVPMFHAAAWGLPFCCIATGAKIVLPGPHLDPGSLVDLMASEKVTVAGGVPTIWIGILQLLDAAKEKSAAPDLSSIRTMVIGGSAAPSSMIEAFQERHGLAVTHAWGMTETSPLGTVARIKRHLLGKSAEERYAIRATQGFAMPLVDVRHRGEQGDLLPWDGQSMGELEVRGPWVARSYFGDEGPDRFTDDGWFKTGDVVTIDPEGYLRITDRSKDVVKSGGEWISSVALENALMAHPAILEAAVFSAHHDRWHERPVGAIVLREGKTATTDELTEFLRDKFTKFWLPDTYVFLAQIPRTSTGKFLKSKLREEHGDILRKSGGAS